MRFSRCLFGSILLSVSLITAASPISTGENCWGAAGARYRVDPWLLHSIAIQESSLRTHVINVNTDGTEDLGLMGINTQWLPKLAKYGVTREVLLTDWCRNIHIGAWILAENFYRYGVTWNSVGIYNAGPAKSVKQQIKRDAYARKISAIYQRSVEKHNLIAR